MAYDALVEEEAYEALVTLPPKYEAVVANEALVEDEA